MSNFHFRPHINDDGMMAIAHTGVPPTATTEIAANANDSDYGSDFDEDALSSVALQLESQPLDGLVLTSIEADPVTEHASTRLLASEQLLCDAISRRTRQSTTRQTRSATKQIHGRRSDQTAFSPSPVASPAAEDVRPREQAKEASVPPETDTRSPLARFRTSPKKPLSVTDIVSPAWCEQQYLFSLSKYGRVKATPAMRQGSSVHKVLEEQVHTSVPVEVQTREDMFGLRLWNVIQGLRSLRSTGITRELALWGTIGDQVIGGVIDEVTATCPDQAAEAIMLGKTEDTNKVRTLESSQQTLESFMKSIKPSAAMLESSKSGVVNGDQMFYVMDVKTRQSRTVPTEESRLRPTRMQLMLYHRLISDLAAGKVSSQAIFERYGLDSAATFSDVFIAEIGKLDFDLAVDVLDSSQDSVAELLEHNTLSVLWDHMVAEYAKTLPTATSLSSLVTAQFRAGSTGAVLGVQSFKVDAEALDAYVNDELDWWKGERPTKGVEIEEAFKCRMCDFAEHCGWRQEKMEETMQKRRAKRQTSRLSGDSAVA